MAGNTVAIKILGDSKSGQQAFRDLNSEADGFASKMDSLGKKMMGAGTLLTAGLTLPIVGVAAVAFNSASALQDNLGQVDSVYKNSADGVMAWAKTTTDAYGISESDALGYAGTLGNIYTAMGFSTDEAAKLSAAVVSQAGDFASFAGTSPEQAYESLLAAQTGEYEQMKKYGVILNEEGVKRKASQMGIWDGVGTLDAHTKALAVNALIQEQSTNVVGDFARTSDGANNTMNASKARFEDLSSTLGTKLLPIGTKIMEFASGLMEKFSGLSDSTQTIILVAVGLAAVLGPLIIGLGAVATAIGAIGLPVIAVIAAIAALAAGVYFLYQNNETFRNGIQTVWEWIQTTALPIAQQFWSTLVLGFQTIVAWVQEKWPIFLLGLQTTFAWLQTNVLPIVQEVVGFVVSTFQQMVAWGTENWPKFQEAIGHVWNVISGYITTVVGIISTVISTAWTVITTLTQGWGDNIANIVGIVWDQIKLVIETVIGIIQNVIGFVMNIINGDWGAAWDNILAILNLAGEWIKGSIGNLWGIIQNLFGMGIDYVRNLWSTIWTWVTDFVRQKLDEAMATVRGLWDGLVGFVSGLPGRVAGAIGGIWDGLTNGFRSAINGVISLWNDLSFTTPSIDIPGLGQVGGKRIDFPDIPFLAKGGNIVGAGSVVVGDAGPEILTLPRGAQVTPLAGNDVDGLIAALEQMLARTASGDVNVYAETNADPHAIAREVAWTFKTAGR